MMRQNPLLPKPFIQLLVELIEMVIDAVELLMIEHLQCKSMKDLQEKSGDYDRFVNFHEFLLNVHIVVEEKVVFPSLSSPLWDDSRNYKEKIKQIAADHKLLDKLAQNLIRWKDGGNEELYNTRMPLYYSLLTEHNGREEAELFHRWRSLDESVYKSTSREIYNIISSFGIDKYRQAMNFSESIFRYVFHEVSSL